jgi:mono/diheme cytochrome c family protein
MNWKLNTLLVASMCLFSPVVVHAREPGDPQKGRVIAQTSCATCHAITASRALSPNLRAPPFLTIAQTPGMTAIALRAALQTSHKRMPNLILRKQTREDVIAYILSLKGPASPEL